MLCRLREKLILKPPRPSSLPPNGEDRRQSGRAMLVPDSASWCDGDDAAAQDVAKPEAVVGFRGEKVMTGAHHQAAIARAIAESVEPVRFPSPELQTKRHKLGGPSTGCGRKFSGARFLARRHAEPV